MTVNFNYLLKVLLFCLLLFISIIFFYTGYQKIKNIQMHTSYSFSEKIDNINVEDKKINLNTINNKIHHEEKFINEQIYENEIILTVKKNDTFSKIIDSYFQNKDNKNKIIQLINKKFDLRKLNIGQKIFLYSENIQKNNKIGKIIIPIDFKTDLVLKKNYLGDYYVNEEMLDINSELTAQKFSITKSLFEDGRISNVPLAILTEIIRIYSFDVDFQRDIQKGNTLEVMYEIFFNEKRKSISYGKIHYINLKLQKNNLEYFLFKTEEGILDYFNKKGKNFKKALMKTPLDGAKLSSNFGMRKHPILGYNKLHRGIDFSAPNRTPVYAAGNGVIEYAGRNGSYGKYIRIRHNSNYKTAYAHLSGFNKETSSKGIRVNQGQIIGYVGSTGSSTGPHLHYEVIYQGSQINPITMKLPSGKALKGKDLIKFKENHKIMYANFLYYLYE